MDCSPPSSSAHGISQARILEWVVISSSRGSSWPSNQTHISCTAGGFFTTESPGKPCLLYTLNWYIVICQLYCNKIGKINNKISFTEKEKTWNTHEIGRNTKTVKNKTNIAHEPRESANNNSFHLMSTFSVPDPWLTFSLYSYLGCRFHCILTWQMKILTEANYLTQGHMATNIWAGSEPSPSLESLSSPGSLPSLAVLWCTSISSLYTYVYVQKNTCVRAQLCLSLQSYGL